MQSTEFTIFTFKMDDFVKGITPNMTSTQVCNVCCYNINNVGHDNVSYTHETSVFTMGYCKLSIVYLVRVCLWIYLCIYERE